MVVFVVCGGSKILLSDVGKYQEVVKNAGDQGLSAERRRVMIDSKVGLDL
jgi:hypothetical protein